MRSAKGDSVFDSVVDKVVTTTDDARNGVNSFGYDYARDFFKARFPRCQAFTLELSSACYFDPQANRSRFTDMQTFEIVGVGILHALAEYLGIGPD